MRFYIDRELFDSLVAQDMKVQLEEVYGWYNKQRNIVDIKPVELKISKFKGVPTNRAI